MDKIKEIIKTPAFWVICVLILVGLIALVLLSKEEKSGYLLLSNISSYTCNEKRCKVVEEDKFEEIASAGDFQVYETSENSGTYKIKYINKWNFFDSNNNWVNMNESFIAGSKDLELKVKEYQTREMSGEEIAILEKHLKENKVNTYSHLEQNEVIEYDFNKDGKNEKILLASNVNDTTEDEKLFAIVIGIVNNKSSVLHVDIYNKNQNFEVPSYQIKGIINILGQKEDYLVLLKGYFSEVGKPSTYIYKNVKNNFENIVESKKK